MSADVIQAQYEQLEEITRRFRRQTDLQAALQKRLRDRVGKLRSAGWAGRGPDAFYAEMENQVFPAMNRPIGALQAGQKITLGIIAIMQQAEQEAARPFGPAGQRQISSLNFNGEHDIAFGGAPTLTPSSGGNTESPPPSLEQAAKQLDDILTPLDWISKFESSSKVFRETLKKVGRILNTVTGERGHLKWMSGFGDVLLGTTKAIGAASEWQMERSGYTSRVNMNT